MVLQSQFACNTRVCVLNISILPAKKNEWLREYVCVYALLAQGYELRRTPDKVARNAHDAYCIQLYICIFRIHFHKHRRLHLEIRAHSAMHSFISRSLEIYYNNTQYVCLCECMSSKPHFKSNLDIRWYTVPIPIDPHGTRVRPSRRGSRVCSLFHSHSSANTAERTSLIFQVQCILELLSFMHWFAIGTQSNGGPYHNTLA